MRPLFIADSAVVLGGVTTGKDVSIWYNAVLRADVGSITIGDCTNVQDGVIIHATEDISIVEIGSFVTIGHGAIIHGAKILDRVLIGMGSIIMDNALIPEDCIVAAGSIVPPNKIFKPRSLIIGSPARVKRELTKEEIRRIKESALHYIKLAKAHLNGEFTT